MTRCIVCLKVGRPGYPQIGNFNAETDRPGLSCVSWGLQILRLPEMSLLSVELSNWRILAAYTMDTMVQWWTYGDDGSLLWGILLSLVMIFAIDWIILRSPSAAGGWCKPAKPNWRVRSQKPGTTLEFRQQHLHRSILILGSSTNLYYSLLQKQFIRRVTKSCFGGCSLLRGIVSTVELQMRHRCLSGTRGHYTNDTNAKQQIRLYLIKQEPSRKIPDSDREAKPGRAAVQHTIFFVFRKNLLNSSTLDLPDAFWKILLFHFLSAEHVLLSAAPILLRLVLQISVT